jgi:hypothetical protein
VSARSVLTGLLAAAGSLLGACGDGAPAPSEKGGSFADRVPLRRIRLENAAPGRVVTAAAMMPLDEKGVTIPGAGIPIPLPPKGLSAPDVVTVEDPIPRPSWARVSLQVRGVRGFLECDTHDYGTEPPAGRVSIEELSVVLSAVPPDGLRLTVTSAARASDSQSRREHVTACPP